jgi:selenocysteine-specific elongation factor
VLDPHPRRHGASPAIGERLGRRARGEPDPAPSRDARFPRRAAGGPSPQPALSAAALQLERRLREAGQEPPIDSELEPVEAGELAALRAAGRAVRVGRNLHFHPEALADVRRRILEHLERRRSITLAELRDDLGTTRKFAQALLEHFDSEKLTRRVGDAHLLRRR